MSTDVDIPGPAQSGADRPRVAVVGHVEWLQFARVDHLPETGEILHAQEAWESTGGGGAVAAAQLAKLAGGCLFYTALGDDDAASASRSQLEALGVTVVAVQRSVPQPRAFVYVDQHGERTITVLGEPEKPCGSDHLPWEELAEIDAVYFAAGDVGAVRAARAAGMLVGTARVIGDLARAGVELDALVYSANDEGESYRAGDLDPLPAVAVGTAGSEGGELLGADGERSRWEAAPLPGAVSDAYGAGDSFAAGFTYGLGAGLRPADAAALGAQCGAAAMTGRGPFAGQLDAAG